MSSKRIISSRELADQLHSAAIRILRQLRKTDEFGELNPPRLSALSVIVFGGPVMLRDLAIAEQVRPPTMTRIVHALEMKGLVIKKQKSNDRRSAYIQATMTGKKMLLAERSRRLQKLIHKINELGNGERAALENALDVISRLAGS